MGKGFFITFEGTEGTGKSTQAALLGEALHREGRKVIVTREPGGTELGEELRRILLGVRYSDLSPVAELFLYMADRVQHMAATVLPALDADQVVICDRFADATVAYQGYGRGIDRALILSLNAEATLGRPPDLTFLLDFGDVGDGLRRAEDRNRQRGAAGREDRFEREETAFHLRVQRGYRAIAGENPDRFRILPADIPVDDLHGRIMSLLGEVLP